jgi:hypothetical protein
MAAFGRLATRSEPISANPWGLKRSRENYLVREDVEHDERGFSRVAAAWDRPARKCRVKWNQSASPVGTTPVLTHTVKPKSFSALTRP